MGGHNSKRVIHITKLLHKVIAIIKSLQQLVPVKELVTQRKISRLHKITNNLPQTYFSRLMLKYKMDVLLEFRVQFLREIQI